MTGCADKLSIVFVIPQESSHTLFYSITIFILFTNTSSEDEKFPSFGGVAKIQRIFDGAVLHFLNT
ncbi:hypothetical protein DDI74_07055 [Chryseobacterium gleum]|nr:hypothetical protein DDI74_07055 [Chryseobacterium gleum]